MRSKIRVRYECQNQELFHAISVACHLVSNIFQEVLVVLWSVFFISSEDLQF